MLPEKLQEAIKQIKIVNEINNSYVYLSFTEEELNTLKEKCQTIIKEIKHYENNLIIDLAVNYKWLPKDYAYEAEKDELAKNESESNYFSNLINKVEQRITALTNNITYSEQERKEAFKAALSYIKAKKNEELEKLLISGKLSKEELKLIVEYEVDEENDLGLLWNAIKNGNLEAIKMLCEAGAEIESTQKFIDENQIKPPLLKAIKDNNSEIIDYLLTKKLNTNIISTELDTVLTNALENNNTDLFKRLISDYNTIFCDENNFNLQKVVESCDIETLDFVFSNVKNLNLNVHVDHDMPILNYILAENTFSYEKDQTVHIKIIEKMVKNGYDINSQEPISRNTVLHYAVDPTYLQDLN